MPVALISVAMVLPAGTTIAILVSQRRRKPRIAAETVAERALRARIEQIAAQERATRMHPDAVRSWMRPL
jgi:hypothetical protein